MALYAPGKSITSNYIHLVWKLEGSPNMTDRVIQLSGWASLPGVMP